MEPNFEGMYAIYGQFFDIDRSADRARLRAERPETMVGDEFEVSASRLISQLLEEEDSVEVEAADKKNIRASIQGWSGCSKREPARRIQNRS